MITIAPALNMKVAPIDAAPAQEVAPEAFAKMLGAFASTPTEGSPKAIAGSPIEAIDLPEFESGSPIARVDLPETEAASPIARVNFPELERASPIAIANLPTPVAVSPIAVANLPAPQAESPIAAIGLPKPAVMSPIAPADTELEPAQTPVPCGLDPMHVRDRTFPPHSPPPASPLSARPPKNVDENTSAQPEATVSSISLPALPATSIASPVAELPAGSVSDQADAAAANGTSAALTIAHTAQVVPARVVERIITQEHVEATSSDRFTQSLMSDVAPHLSSKNGSPVETAGGRIDATAKAQAVLAALTPATLARLMMSNETKAPRAGHAAPDIAAPVNIMPAATPMISPIVALAGAGQAGPIAEAVSAPGTTAEFVIEQQLNMAYEGEWLDQLARDIVRTGGQEGSLRFRLNPETLGSLHVELAQGQAGTSVRLTAETEAARALLADAQPRLVAEARAQGLRLADAHVDLHHGGQPAAEQGRQQARDEAVIRTASAADAEREQSPKPTRNASERFA